jgi:hypothetical protein
VQSYWGSFARSGVAGGGYAPTPLYWPAITPNNATLMLFRTPGNAAVAELDAGKCALFDSIGYTWY